MDAKEPTVEQSKVVEETKQSPLQEPKLDKQMASSKTDAQLDQLMGCVSQLKNVNRDIGQTIQRQNKILEGVNGKMDGTSNRLEKVNSKLEKIQRK